MRTGLYHHSFTRNMKLYCASRQTQEEAQTQGECPLHTPSLSSVLPFFLFPLCQPRLLFPSRFTSNMTFSRKLSMLPLSWILQVFIEHLLFPGTNYKDKYGPILVLMPNEDTQQITPLLCFHPSLSPQLLVSCHTVSRWF